MKNLKLYGILLILVITGCSAAQKARKEEREKLIQSRGVYCDFVSESDFKDVDIELNLRIGKRCDANKPFSITNYKRVSENPGVLYCCNADPRASFSSSESSDATPPQSESSSDKKTTPTTNK